MDSAIEKVAKSCEACHEAKQGPAKAPRFGQVGHGNGYTWTTQGHLWGKTSCS